MKLEINQKVIQETCRDINLLLLNIKEHILKINIKKLIKISILKMIFKKLNVLFKLIPNIKKP